MNEFHSWPLSDKCVAITTTTSLGNMAYQVGNENDNVKERRIKLSNLLNIDYENFTFVHQFHSVVIKEVTLLNKGKGLDSFESGIEADALYTKENNIPLGIFHADCEPIFFISEVDHLVGVIHAGYRGTIKGVVGKVVKEVIEKENINPEHLKFFVGPTQNPEWLIINNIEDIEVINENGFENYLVNDHFNVRKTNYDSLTQLGVLKENIFDCQIDTVTNESCFSAYKKTPIGRMTSIIYLK